MSEDAARLGALEAELGHRFRDAGLLATALTHASRAHEVDGGRGNERLEYLGDSVLDLVIAERLYALHPDWSEGELTRARATLVNRSALADCARELGLDGWVRLGRTEQRSGGRDKDSILANCFEAVVGALYLDGGLAPVEALARRVYGPSLESGATPGRRDPKTAFQEWAHARFRETPAYRTIDDSGDEHDEERFCVEVCIGEQVWGEGAGRSKKLAERSAAEAALRRAAHGDG